MPDVDSPHSSGQKRFNPAIFREVDVVDAGHDRGYDIVYKVKVFWGEIPEGCAHEVGAARDSGVSRGEEKGKVSTNAIYTFYHLVALCGVFKSVSEALCMDGETKEE